MKEKRVYIVPMAVLDEISYDHDYDYDSITDDAWIAEAERVGYVYTIEGFLEEWNDSLMFPERDAHMLRVIEVDSYN